MDGKMELKLLNEQIEILLEEFEEIHGKQVKSITFERLSFDKGHKKFEYKVDCN